jgi:hypothetical protein
MSGAPGQVDDVLREVAQRVKRQEAERAPRDAQRPMGREMPGAAGTDPARNREERADDC